jgi:hypothetical protein
MKKIIIILLPFLILICSCVSQRTIKKQEEYKYLPVGHELLLNAGNNYNTTRNISANFSSYYRSLSQELPYIEKIEYIKINEYGDRYCYCDDNNALVGAFNYRLPDIHGFQVYYLTKQVCNARYKNSMQEICGNLILIDTISKNAKFINVFFEGYVEYGYASRFFTIDKNYNITLFNYFCSEGCSISKKYLITISPNQKIDIFECNCLNQENIYDIFSSSNEIPDVWIKKDSCQYYYQDLYYNNLQRRRFPYPASNYIRPEEVKLIVEDSVAYWSKYVETGNQRALNDSIKYLKKIDSLQNVIYPVDSILPFGPKSLEYLVNTNQNKIKFTITDRKNVYEHRKFQNFITEKGVKNRKLIYEAWMYYLNFHPNEYYIYEEDRIFLKLKTLQYIYLDEDIEDMNIEQKSDNFDEDGMLSRYEVNSAAWYASELFKENGIGYIAVRIPNIEGFEVYYSTTGVDAWDNSCDVQGKTEEACCFYHNNGDNYNCASDGYLIFYDRKKQHGNIISVYKLENSGFRFFYISKDKTIHVFEGQSGRRSWYSIDEETMDLSKTHEIKITKDKKFIINKIVEND